MPSAVRQMAPRPPITLVPPTTTAAKAPKTTSMPLPAWPVAVRETTIAPPMPAASPLKVKAATFIARVLMPDSRAASGLPPTAYSQRPNFVRERTKPQAKAATMRIQIEYFTPKQLVGPQREERPGR